MFYYLDPFLSTYCTGYLGYLFQYMYADDVLYPHLLLFIHITGNFSTLLISLSF
jgi:hypothetical protein